MRIGVAVLVLGVAVAASAFVFGVRDTHSSDNCASSYSSPSHPCSWKTTPSWVNPLGVFVIFVGIAGAAVVLTAQRRSAN